MNQVKIYVSGILAFLLGVFAASYFNGCGKFEPPVIKEYKRDTTYISRDSIIYKKLKKDTTIYTDTGSHSYISDTVFVLKDYNSVNVYKDTLSIDFGNIYITDTITKNSISRRIYNYDFSIPIYTDSVIIKEKFKRSFFWGFSGGFMNNKINDASVNLFMETPKRRLYGVGVGVGSDGVQYRGTILIKL